MRRSLAVWCEQYRVGTLATSDGVWTFSYSPAWKALEEAFALSPHFPLDVGTFVDTGDDRRVLWFFDNLLPEGGVRQALAKQAKVAEKDSFALLQRYGAESAGALTLLPDDGRQPPSGGYEELTEKQLGVLVRRLPKVPFIDAEGRARMSLAGTQHKLGLHRDGERWLLPVGGSSSVILKPGIAGKEFPCAPANELFCQRLAEAVGVEVPHCELVRVPEPIYVVTRYDRRVQDGRVRRRHQIDLCQLLNRWPGYKYESEGGASIEEAYRALDRTRQPARSRAAFLRWFVFNYLIGNSDAHAKNLSFVVSPGRIDLAPAYDLLSVRAYGEDYDYMAMSIASETRYGWIEREQWDTLASSLKLKKAYLTRIRRELAETVPRAARELFAKLDFVDDERDLIRKVLAIIELHASYMRKGL